MKISELQKRLFTSLVLIPTLIFLATFSQELFVLLLIFITIIASYEWYNLNKKKISLDTFVGFIIIFTSIYFAYILRSDNQKDIVLFLWIIFVCIFSDIGGYVVGKIVGGVKITKISPNKTYAGMFGSFIFSLLPILFLYFLPVELKSSFTIIQYVSLSLLFSLICQFGDITVSYYKRKNKKKDTGTIFPGHGGLLDRIDGIIFVLLISGFLKILKII